MKKIGQVGIAALMIMVLVAGMALLVGCGGGSADEGIEGTWKLTKVEAGGVEVGENMLGSFDYNFVFEADSKASVRVMGQSYETTYTFANNEVTFGDAALGTLKLVKNGNKLTLDDTAGTVMEFTKQ
ncbi:MAG: hypothetical protein LBS58_02905 [Coriobacteriales bacterium]|jgi:hypothetical protein|nr:hypothetical protein [Coriobacteriales bacterium]